MTDSKSEAKHIVIVGSVNADLFLEIERLPRRGETITASDESGFWLPGGKGANQAVGIARLLDPKNGSKALFACRTGNDGNGEMLRKQLIGYGVDLRHASVSQRATGQALILLQKGGDNSIVIASGANRNWDSKLPDELVRSIQQAGVVMLQREIPAAVNLAVSQIASSSGVPVVHDAGGEDSPLDDAILPHLFLLAPNETELANLTGLPTETEPQIVTAAKKLQSRGVKNVLVSLGERGSLFVQQDGSVVTRPAFQVPKVVDTTGAGDTFRAAFTVALFERKSIDECLRFASAASALCIQVKGAMPSVPSLKETLAFLESNPKTLDASTPSDASIAKPSSTDGKSSS